MTERETGATSVRTRVARNAVQQLRVTFPILDREEEHSPEQELTDDLISIIVWFAGKWYGMRLHK